MGHRILYIQKPKVQGIKYGYLYNWYAATDARSISANGWHVPDKTELETLVGYLGGETVAGGKLKETGFEYWSTPNTGATNEVGFNARGSGARAGINGTFNSLMQNTSFWSSAIQLGHANRLTLHHNLDSCNIGNTNLWYGSPIRLIKDLTTLTHGETGVYIGNDGKRYKTICIGNQEWLASNLAETLYRNGDPIPTVEDNATWAGLTTGAKCAYNNDWNNVYK